MPRKNAAERHLSSAPTAGEWPPQGSELVDAIVAVNHPSRRRLYEILSIHGPASVGGLSRETGMAVGSVSHHLKVLHRNGFIDPAPEESGDSRESWWRAVHRSLSWSVQAYGQGTGARAVADLAEFANLRHQEAATVAWINARETLPRPWRDRGLNTHTFVRATPEQFDELAERLSAVATAWHEEVLRDQTERPDITRSPIRMVLRIFPSTPGDAC